MAADRSDHEPIDAEYEPAERRANGVTMGAAMGMAVASAITGGVMGAVAPRIQAFAPVLDAAAPDDLTQVREAQAASRKILAEASEKLRLIDASGGVSPEFKADYLQLKADVSRAQFKLARIDVGLKLFPDGPAETAALRDRLVALEKPPEGEGGASAARSINALSARIDGLEKRAGQAFAFDEAAGASPGEIMARLNAVAAKQKELETKIAAAATVTSVAALSGDLTKLQGEFSSIARGAKDATEAARASYAVAAATDAARSSGPFEPAYSALQAVLPNDPNVAALAPLARKGAPTREELRDEYAKLELEVVRAARAAEAGGGVWGQVQASMAQFIVVRRASDVDISGDLVDSASARLAANDFEGAVAQLSRLTGEPARRVAPWLAKAKMRVEIDQRLAAIRTQLSRKG